MNDLRSVLSLNVLHTEQHCCSCYAFYIETVLKYWLYMQKQVIFPLTEEIQDFQSIVSNL